MTFTNLYLPETKNKLWAADIDLQADTVLIDELSKKSGVPPEIFHGMTLKSYESYLFERIHSKSQGTPFISPLGMRGRRSTLPGLRFCPQCLKEDSFPYFRKKWRIAFSVACLRHGCYLREACITCGAPLTPYLSFNNAPNFRCYKCDEQLNNTGVSVSVDAKVLATLAHLFKILDSGYIRIGGKPIYSHLYFSVIHQILKLMLSKRYGPQLCEGVGLSLSGFGAVKDFESMPIKVQAKMIGKAVWLLDNWPNRLVGICTDHRLWSSSVLRDFDNAPHWFREIITDSLCRPDRIVSDEEIRSAASYLGKRGMTVNEAALSSLLGVRQVFRKRKMKLSDLDSELDQ